MYVNIVQLECKPEYREAFIEAYVEDGRASCRDEPGTIRLDVIQDHANPNRIYLYELYRDRAAFEAHRQGPHAQRARATVKDWLVAPPSGLATGFTLFPTYDE